MSFPSPARDYAEKSISLDKELVKHPHATFFMNCLVLKKPYRFCW